MVNLKLLTFLTLLFGSISANAGWLSSNTDSWRVTTVSSTGPLLAVDLPNSNGKRRSVFVAFEYARQCDPIFSYGEQIGNSLGKPVSQAALTKSKIGINLNGSFYTWYAAITKYEKGYEAGFGIQNDLLQQLLINVSSLSYVTPYGEVVDLPTKNFSQGFLKAIEICRKKVKN